MDETNQQNEQNQNEALAYENIEQPQSVPVTINVTGASDAQENQIEEPNLEEAEKEVLDANPQTSNEELAEVQSALQTFEAKADNEEVQVDEGLPHGEESPAAVGVDPMEQIQAQEAESMSSLQNSTTSDSSEMPSGETSDETQGGETESLNENNQIPPQATEDKDTMMSLEAEPTMNNEEAAKESIAETQAQEPVEEDAVVAQEVSTNSAMDEIVAPSAVAAAEAAGTAGSNAITGTPETAKTENAQVIQADVKPAKKPSSKRGLLVAIVVLVTLLLAGGAVAYYFLQPKDSNNTENNNSNSGNTSNVLLDTNTTSSPGDTVEAATLDDYKASCGGGKVTNASAYAGDSPHKVVFFEQGSDSKYAMSLVEFADTTWAADSKDVTSGQVVVCVSRKAGSETKLKACPITDPETKVTVDVDYYSTTYDIAVYNAQTGESLGTFESASTDTVCPTTAVYDKADPMIFASYDLADVESLIKDIVTKKV
ncbi:hypothetical protein KC930_02185 [Candidatus Saccharibacteria bacterium]|nr:hypothetical protein [Candidatus Saccharibacteria bacterium]